MKKNISLVRKRSKLSFQKKNTEVTPVSYIRVKYIPYGGTSEGSDDERQSLNTQNAENEIVMNINCPIRLLMEYIRGTVKIPETVDFDLFDEKGNLQDTFKINPELMASTILSPKGVYFIVLLPKSNQGLFLKPQILINRGGRVNTDYITRIRRQLNAANRILSAQIAKKKSLLSIRSRSQISLSARSRSKVSLSARSKIGYDFNFSTGFI